MRGRYMLFIFCIVGVFGFLFIVELKTRHELEELRAEARKAPENTMAGPAPDGVHPWSVAESQQWLKLAVASAVGATQTSATVSEPVAAEPARRPVLQEAQENVLSAYGKEAPDPTWSREAAQDLEAGIRQALPEGSRLLSVECRTTLCLVDVLHSDEATAHAAGLGSWMLTAFRDWHGAVFVAGEKEDRGELVQTLMAIKENTVPPYAGL